MTKLLLRTQPASARIKLILVRGQPASSIVSFRAASPASVGMDGYRDVTSNEQSIASNGICVWLRIVIRWVLEVMYVGIC
jgi:hypothetical protein